MNNSLPGQADCGIGCVCAQINPSLASLLSNQLFRTLLQSLLSSVGILPGGKTENLHLALISFELILEKHPADPSDLGVPHLGVLRVLSAFVIITKQLRRSEQGTLRALDPPRWN